MQKMDFLDEFSVSFKPKRGVNYLKLLPTKPFQITTMSLSGAGDFDGVVALTPDLSDLLDDIRTFCYRRIYAKMKTKANKDGINLFASNKILFNCIRTRLDIDPSVEILVLPATTGSFGGIGTRIAAEPTMLDVNGPELRIEYHTGKEYTFNCGRADETVCADRRFESLIDEAYDLPSVINWITKDFFLKVIKLKVGDDVYQELEQEML